MEVKIGKVLLGDGITGVLDNKDAFINLFNEAVFIKESITVDSKKITRNEKEDMYDSISIIDDLDKSTNYNYTVYEYLKKVIIDDEINIRNYHKKITDSMKIISFSEAYLKKSISNLSAFEQKMIAFAGSLLKNPKILVFNNFFKGIAFKNIRTIMRLINQMVDKYEKKVIICSNDIDFLYNYSQNIIIFDDQGLVVQGNTNSVFEEKGKILEEKKIELPLSVQFVKKSREKGIKLNYNKDIRDLIKDIYKKV